MVLTIFAGIAEFERDLIRDRTLTGRIAAKRRGVRFGRPVKLNPEQKELATQLFEEGKSAEQIATTFNVHPATIYRLGSSDQRMYRKTSSLERALVKIPIVC